jgi:putative ABC transport system permease protein
MTWIALKMLVGDKAKFFGIVLGLTFAALLITQQGSIFCGIMLRTCAQITDITGADLWVMEPNVRFIDDVKPMLDTSLYRVRGVEGVQWAVPLYKGNARIKLSFSVRKFSDQNGQPDWQLIPPRYVLKPDPSRNRDNPDQPKLTFAPEGIAAGAGPPDATPKKSTTPPSPGSTPPEQILKFDVVEQVVLLGLDDASMIGSPPTERIWIGRLEDLRKPDSVIVDRVGLRKIFPHLAGKVPDPDTPTGKRDLAKFLNLEFEMNDRRAVIVGICEASRTFQTNPVIYTTYSRAKQFVPRERKLLSFILAKTQPGFPPDTVAQNIFALTGLKASTSEDFKWKTIQYYLKYTGIPVNFGITVLLGFLVGTAIAGQTFYNFTIENLKQFGALKAMGTNNLRIIAMILLQALVVGILGFGIGVGLASVFGVMSRGTELAFFTPWQLLGIAAAAVLFICVLASLISVRRVVVLEPAVVFRG